MSWRWIDGKGERGKGKKFYIYSSLIILHGNLLLVVFSKVEESNICVCVCVCEEKGDI